MPGELKTILGNCLAHGRRQFVDVAARFPEECRHLLETLRDVYKHDEVAKERNLSPEERLSFHQVESGPLMDDLKVWLLRQFEDRLVEPNSPLGEAISYMLNHWEKLTLFLRQPGAPLDNNLGYVRGHWGIENQLHWSLDVTFREDTLRQRVGHSAENLSRIRRLALNLLRRDKTCRAGIKGKRLQACLKDEYLLRVLSTVCHKYDDVC